MHQSAVTDARRMGQAEAGDDPVTRLHRMKEGDSVRAKIFRFDPSIDPEPRYVEYRVPYSRKMRVLDVLNYIAEDLEEDLAYRWFCGVKKCGTCAVRMNGREILSCWEPAEPDMVIEPLRHAPLVRDLVVDREPYEQLVFRLLPWLGRTEPYAGFPERLSHRDMKPAVNALNCLSCLSCLSACPVLDLGDETNFSGPAPLVQLAQTALDPRDGMDRGTIAYDVAGIFNCVSCYKCEEVCPVGIPVVSGVIEPLKAMAYASRPGQVRHPGVFSDIIERRGRIDPSELVLRVQGIGALSRLGRVLRLLVRGKINPLRTFFGKPISGIEKIANIFTNTRTRA
jgi:succinate dehydrogenase/fumarate reductase iron-sulfur protein